MKITYLDQYYNRPSMPGGTRTYELAKRLVLYGHQVSIVTTKREHFDNFKSIEMTLDDGINIHWIPGKYSNKMSFTQRICSFIYYSYRSSLYSSNIEADVIFATSTPLTIAIPGVYSAKKLGIPMVFEVRDLWPEMPIAIGALKNPLLKWMARKLERFAYRNASQVVALSPGMAEGVAETGYPRNKIHTIPNSCDLGRFSPDPEARSRFQIQFPEMGKGPLVLYAGTMGRVNEVSYLVQIAAALLKSHPEIRFVVFGAGSEAEKTRELASSLGVLDQNYFQYGRIPKEQVVDAFLTADVVTSLFANIPEMEKNSANKFFDGLAAAKPLAINYGGWMADLLRETGAGLVLDRTPEIAATQIVDFLSDSETFVKAGQAARKLAEERFSRDKLAKELEQVLHCAVEEYKPRNTPNTRKRV